MDWVIQITVCAYYIGLGATIPPMPITYVVNYPSADQFTFKADYAYTGLPCLGSPDTSYNVVYDCVQLPGQSFTNLAIDPATKLVSIASTFTDLPGIYTF